MKIAIGIPGYGPGNIFVIPLMNVMADHAGWDIHFRETSTSFLTLNFNELWCWALNLREEGKATHFLMAHSDIKPYENDWLDIMLAEMEKANAQVLSAISPIKNWLGLTSTAFDNDAWRPTRLMIDQMHKLPPTWTCNKLLFNTGLMLVDMRDSWTEEICFQVRNWMGKIDGQWTHRAEPEDWHFSRQCNKLGVRTYVTRAVTVEHSGFSMYSTKVKFGVETDPVNKSTEVVQIIDIDGSTIPLSLGDISE